jgi:hypothetical protein
MDRPMEKRAPSKTKRGPSGREDLEKPEGDGFGKMNLSVLTDHPGCTAGPSATVVPDI